MRLWAPSQKTREFLEIAVSLCQSPFRGRAFFRGAIAFLGLATVAGCSSTPSGQHFASRRPGDIDPRYGVRASPRLYADGETPPKGGGGYMVGKPYQIAGRTYYPSERPMAATGIASYYGSDFHGRKTANGEIFDRTSISAAHPTMPLPSYARVTNLRNAHSIVVRVNDRGPYHGGRVMDVSQRAAEALDFRQNGTAPVKVEWLGRASLAGSDDEKLLATLRQDGRPAILDGDDSPPVMVASHEEPVRTASLEKPRHAAAARDDDETDDRISTPPTPPARNAALGKETDTTSTIGAKKFNAPLPPARPFDLGVTGDRLKAAHKQAMN